MPDSMLNALYTSSRTCQEARNFHFPVLSEAQTLNDLLKAEIAFRVEMAQLQKPALPFTPVAALWMPQTALDPVEPPELPKELLRQRPTSPDGVLILKSSPSDTYGNKNFGLAC